MLKVHQMHCTDDLTTGFALLNPAPIIPPSYILLIYTPMDVKINTQLVTVLEKQTVTQASQ